MSPKTLQLYKDRLNEMRTRLQRAVEDSISSVAEQIETSNEPETTNISGIESEAVIEQTEVGLLREVQAALDRIDAGVFGRCISCSEIIPQDRLQTIPYTPYCIQCERESERN